MCTDESAYRREIASLREALALARDLNEPLVYFPGAPIYGKFGDVVTEATPCRPVTRYGRHQAECEELVCAGPAPFLSARLSNAVGLSSNHRQLVPALIAQILRGHVRVEKFAHRDLIDVEDIVRLVQEMLSLGVRDEIVTVASGRSVPVSEIVERATELLNCRPNIAEHAAGEIQRFGIGRLESYCGTLLFDADYPLRTLARYAPGIAEFFRGSPF